MIKSGDLVYFKRAKKESKRKSHEFEFKGLGFGVYLGALPPFGKEPDGSQIFRMMGAIGFLTFDDVAEFLGDDEHGATCVKKFEDKYYGKVIPGLPPEEAPVEANPEESKSEIILPPKPPALVGLDGKVLSTEKPE